MRIKIFDDGDGGTYTLDISVDDALKIYNMQTLHKNRVELPSIGGNATIANGCINIMYKNGATGLGSIGASLLTLQKIIDAAMQDQADEDNKDD